MKFLFSCWKHEWVQQTSEIFFNMRREILYLCAVMLCPLCMLCYVVLLQNKELLVSDKEKGGTITVGDFINGATKGIGLILYYVKKVICFTFCTFWFFWCQACTGILGSLSTVVPQDFMLKHRRSKKCNPHISVNQFRNKRETWAELTFAKTPATVTGDRENIGQ